MKLHERGESLLAEAVELLPQDVDLLGVLLHCLHETLALFHFFEIALRRTNGALVLLNAPTATNNTRLAALFASCCIGTTALRRTQTADVLTLDDVLLQFPKLLLEHRILRLPELRC